MKVLIQAIVGVFVFIVDVVCDKRSYTQFYVLEIITRVPYFSCLSVPHLHKIPGFWSKVTCLKVHFAEN